jgi:hypothetical protein
MASEPAESKQVNELHVSLECEGGLTFYRTLRPEGGVSIPELVAAAREDEGFCSPFVEGGQIEVNERGRKVVLGNYRTDDGCTLDEFAEITSIEVEYDDGTTEVVPLTTNASEGGSKSAE